MMEPTSVEEVSSRIRRKLQMLDDRPEPAPLPGPEELGQLRARIRLLREDCRKIGQLPPRPATLRGTMGAFLVSIVHRCLFWYTPPIQYVLSGFSDAMEEMYDRLLGQIQATEARLLADQQERETRLTRGLEARHREWSAGQQSLSRHLETVSQRLESVSGHLEDTYAGTQKELHSLRREVLGLSLRLSKMLEESPRNLPSRDHEGAVSSQASGNLAHDHLSHDLGAMYIGFEDVFRGSQSDILEGLRHYLPWVRKAGEGAVVLDIGCGRGEWLEVLRQEGFDVRGVDSNSAMVAECRAKGLHVEQADVVEYLARLPDASLGVVTGFHIVEHLPFDVLIRLLDEVTRVLRPGGVAIYETPNPDNLLVGARNFYYDPTHRNPIPSATLRFLVEARGLAEVEVLPLHPCDPVNLVPDPDNSIIIQKFNQFFYGPQDYAVVGRKV